MGITDDQRQALRMLADSPEGCTVPMMLARGCAIMELRRLVRGELATAGRERVPRSRPSGTVVRLRITQAGRRCLRLRLYDRFAYFRPEARQRPRCPSWPSACNEHSVGGLVTAVKINCDFLAADRWKVKGSSVSSVMAAVAQG